MATFTKVAVLGKGVLGSPTVSELVNSGFTVTVLTRSAASVKDLPSGVATVEVDYASAESVENALRGQDVVISTLGFDALEGQKSIIDAAIKAGVKRFVPSDFGSILSDPRAPEMLPFAAKLVGIREYLAQKAKEGSLEFTIFSVGGFLDLLLAPPFLVNFKERTAMVFDDGNHPMSASTLDTIAKAIASSLKKPEETKNRYLFIHDIVITQAKFLELGKKYFSGNWTVSHIDGEIAFQGALAASKEDPGQETVYKLMGASLLAGKFKAAYDSVDNELLGLGFLSDEDLEAKVAALAA